MKNPLFTLALSLCSLFFVPCSLQAQTIPPPYINYQAVLYDLNGANPNNPLINQSFTTFVNINDELGNLLYREEHYASTDANGLITVKMGDGLYTAGPITNFNQINWGVGKYYLVVDFDINGTISSTAPEQLVTVPYSFYAGNAGNGMTAVADNGNGTLTFTYANGATYTTPTLAGIQGPAGPVGPSGASGAAGQSAYDLWLGQGNTGTVQDFLSTSAYQIWLAQGNTGTAQDFLNTLVGPQGPQGIQGPAGNDGAIGAQGPIGLAGVTGPQGIQGPAGNDGSTGPQGPIGITGAQGPQGPIGLTGPTGPNGRSAYEIALLNGFVGTETQWLLSLVGATGPQGNQGPAGVDGAIGPQGIQGPAGNDGAIGLQGPIGLTGSAGPQGPIGLTGPTGPAGATGAQGIQGIVGNNGTNGAQGPIGLTGPAGPQGIQEVNLGFSLSSTWTCPSGVTQITVELWGGGGGGGGSSLSVSCSVSSGGGKGGDGGYTKAIVNVTAGTVYTITVGNGGNGGGQLFDGQAGGISSFGGLVTGAGGGPGLKGNCIGGGGANGAIVNYTYLPLATRTYIPSGFVQIIPGNKAPGGTGGYVYSGCGGSCVQSGQNGEAGFVAISY